MPINNGNHIQIGVGFNVDKSGLEQLQSLVQQIANRAHDPGQKMNDGLRKAAATAEQLNGILAKTFNNDLGTLNVMKFNEELAKSGMTMQSIQKDFAKAGSSGALAYNRLAQSILNTNFQLKESNKLLDSMATTMANTVRWTITSGIVNAITTSISKAVTYAKQLDSSLNDIRIVTDKSASSMASFAEDANNAAKALGASTLEYTNASLIYYQQGLSDEEVKARAETTVKAANVTGQTGAAVSEQLTAVWNGYKATAEETELYVDKLAAVAATTAADLEELSIGMSKVAAAANAMGVDFDDLNAQIATIVSVTRQAPESVGTALKTIYGRLGDLQVDGVDEFGVSLGKVSGQLKSMGIDILDINGEMRDMTSVMAEVAEKWDTWTRAQQQAAAIAMAGKRQYNNLVALFENWDMYSEALETSRDALGTLQHQQDIYMESTEAKLKKLKATTQDLYHDFVKTDEINKGIEGLTNLVNVFDNFIESFGGGSKAILAFGTILSNIFNKQIIDGLNNTINKFDVIRQNTELLKTQYETMQGRFLQTNDPTVQASAAGLKEQIAIYERLREVRLGLSQEQINDVIQHQEKIGKLEEEIQLSEIELEKKREIAGISSEDNQLIKNYQKSLEDVNNTYEQMTTELEKNQILIEKTQQAMRRGIDKTHTVEQLEHIRQLIEAIKNESSITVANGSKTFSDLEKIYEELDNSARATNTLKDNEKEINKILSIILSQYKTETKEQERRNTAAREYIDILSQQRTKQDTQQMLKNETDAMLELGERSHFTAQAITMLTSSLGSMAMAWSSVSSLIKTINDDEISMGDKITRAIMTFSFTVPMLISSFSKIKEVFGVTTSLLDVYNAKMALKTAIDARDSAASAARVALFKVFNTTQKEQVTDALALVSTKQLDLVATNESNAGLVAYNINKKLGNTLTEEQVLALKALIIQEAKEKAVKDAETASQNAFNASLLACPAVWIAAALATVVGVTALVIKNQEEALQREIDLNNATIERINQIQSEINANQKLCDEYEQLYKQYKNHEVEKNALYDVTDQLCDKYGLEDGFLAKLTGDYDGLTDAIRNAREEELKYGIEESTKKVSRAAANIFGIGKQNGGMSSDMAYGVSLSGGWKYDESNAIKDIFIKNFPHAVEFSNDLGFSASLNLISEAKENFSVEDVIEYYETLQKAVDEIDKLVDIGVIGEGERTDSEYYNSATKILETMTPAIKEYKTALEELADYQTQKTFLDEDISSTSSIEEYFNKIESIRNQLNNEFNNDTEKVNKLINTYVQGMDNEFVQLGAGLTALKNKLKLSDSEFQKIIDNWSLEDIKLLLSGRVDFDGLQTEKDLRDALKVAKDSLNEEDLTVAVSLRAKIASDKKLTKSQIKEMASEESTLEQDYEVELSDFDNQSQLEQVDTLNQIVNDKIALNNKYIENAKEAAKEDARLTQIKLDNYQKERDALQEKANLAQRSGYGINITEEEINRLEELNELIPKVEDKWADYNEIAENGLGIDKISDTIYDNLINGIDGVITEAEVLKDLTDDIGENWTIAADKLERFGKNFPEIVADQENYNFLQDGSIQLTEQGKQALEDTLNIRKQNIQASAEEYRLELQKQADIQAATAEYYEEQARLLQEYLTTDADAKDTQAQLEENLTNYKQQLMELTGKNDAELNRIIQENLGMTTVNARMDTNAIYDYWCSVGEAAALAGQAYDSKSFTPPGFSGSTGSGGANSGLKTFEAVSADDAGFALERLSSDDIQAMIDASLEKAQRARNKESTLRSKMLGMGGDVGALSESIDNAISGKGNGKNKGGGGGKDKKDKDEKKLEDEFDRYWELKKAIEAVDHSLKILEKDKKNLYGYQLADALKYENQLLDQQAGYYEQLLAAQEQEAAELRNQLGTMGVVFDASGAIVNYAEATAKALAAYNAAIQQYNAGLIDETTLGVAEKSFENFKKLLSRYDTLYYKEMQDTMDKLDDIRREKLDNNLKAWEAVLKVKLDLKELKRGWNDFLKEIQEDFQQVYQDLTVEAKRLMDDAKTYIGKDGSIMTIIDAIHDVTHEIDVMRGGGESSMFESISQAQEKLKELNDELQDAATGLHDLWEEAWDNLLNGIDQVADKLDDVIEQYEKLNEEIEFQGQLIELLYGDEAYGMLDDLYKGQEKSLSNQIQSLKTETDMWHQLWIESGATMDNQENWTEEQQKYYEQWMEAQSDLNDLVIDYIKLLKEDYLNTIKLIMKELDHAITGSSLDRVKTQWERISDYADKYLDDVEKAYEVQKLANKIDESIAKADNLKDQQKLQALREKEINYLREKEHLTQYDLDAAEARYQIALKEMALEDAQNNKTQMKLVRNEQGNWAYQYVADEEDVMNKRQELLDAFNELYQLADAAYEENLNSLIELQEKYYEKTLEIAENDNLTEQEKEEQMLELREWYLEQYALLAEENQLYRNDLATAGAAILLEVYQQDEEAFTGMTERERELVKTLIEENIADYMGLEEAVKENLNNIGTQSKEVMAAMRLDWTSLAQAIADFWNGDHGGTVKVEVINAYNAIIKANEDFKLKVDWLAQAVERNFGPDGIKGAIEAAANATDNLKYKTQQLVDDGIRYIALLKQAVEQIAAAWQSVQQEIINAIGLLEKYISMIAGYNAAVQDHNAKVAAAQQAAAQQAANGGGGTPNSQPAKRPDGSNDYWTQSDYEYAKYQSSGGTLSHADWVNQYRGNTTIAEIRKKHAGANTTDTGYYFASGGYTGSWENGDNDGKLAFLHQKELVLNKDDTANFLAGINTIRDLSGLNGSINNAILGSIANMVAAIGNKKLGIPNSTTINETTETTGGDVFNITAEFPNANDVNEIREALMSLPNLASQYVARNGK